MAESGLKGYELGSWHGVFVPARTPKDIVQKLNEAIVKGIHAPDVKEKLAALGVEPVGSSVADFTRFAHAEVPKWAKVVKESGAKAE
jgi:tripartite-type tricarboxylate transporter receptor subunit TctC